MNKRPDLRLVVGKPPLDVLWQRFVDAKKRAETTLDINDGIAAGKAYGAFLRAVASQEAA